MEMRSTKFFPETDCLRQEITDPMITIHSIVLAYLPIKKNYSVIFKNSDFDLLAKFP